MKKLTKNQRDYQMRKAVKRIRAQRLKARRYYLTQIKTGQLKLERTRVYNCLANYGPDVDIQRVGRILVAQVGNGDDQHIARRHP